MEQLRIKSPERYYSVVILGTGVEDGSSGVNSTESSLLQALPNGKIADQVKFHAVQYQEALGRNFLQDIVNRTGGFFFEYKGDPPADFFLRLSF